MKPAIAEIFKANLAARLLIAEVGSFGAEAPTALNDKEPRIRVLRGRCV